MATLIKKTGNILNDAKAQFITDLGGTIGYNWDMEQIGDFVKYTMHGYVNGKCVQMSKDNWNGQDNLYLNGCPVIIN